MRLDHVLVDAAEGVQLVRLVGGGSAGQQVQVVRQEQSDCDAHDQCEEEQADQLQVPVGDVVQDHQPRGAILLVSGGVHKH